MAQTFDLSRFTEAHKHDYERALREIRNGRKETHWMWYIFPQIHGLGDSSMSLFYAIRNLDEAAAFLADPYLGMNLREISEALLTLETNRPQDVFYWPDDMKLRSCMTLFSLVDKEENSVFSRVLDKYFGGKQDSKTLEILGIN